MTKNDAEDNIRVDGALIRQTRKALGLTIEALAESADLSTGYVSRMERGERNVSLKNLRLMADALNVPPSTLVIDPDAPDQEQTVTRDVPILTWVSAGSPEVPEMSVEQIGRIKVGDLDPRGDWIALQVEGDSMNMISPHGSIILVDRHDKRLISGRCYVIANGDHEVTYKRYRANPNRMEPVSTNAAHEPIFYDHEPRIIGRVRKTIYEM